MIRRPGLGGAYELFSKTVLVGPLSDLLMTTLPGRPTGIEAGAATIEGSHVQGNERLLCWNLLPELTWPSLPVLPSDVHLSTKERYHGPACQLRASGYPFPMQTTVLVLFAGI